MLLLSLYCSLVYSQKIIERPDLGINNYPGDIVKVEVLAQSTLVYFKLKGKPGETLPEHQNAYIVDVATQIELKVIKAEGIRLGAKNTMPSTGVLSYTLQFPKLKPETKWIDFISGKTKKSWFIYAAFLGEKDKAVPKAVKTWLDKEVSTPTKAPLKDYTTDAFFNKNKGRLVGYIKGYSSRLGFKTGIIYAKNKVTREQYPIVVPVAENGRFEIDVPLSHPSSFSLKFGKIKRCSVYLEPEQTLAVIVGAKNYYLGALAETAKELSAFRLIRMSGRNFKKHITTLKPKIFKKRQLAIYKRNEAKIEAYLKAHNIKPNSKSAILLRHKNEMANASNLIDFEKRRSRALEKDSTNLVLKTTADASYYDFLQNIDFNAKSLLVLEDFSKFINRLEFSNPLIVSPKRDIIRSKTTFETYLEEEGITITAADKAHQASRSSKKIVSAKEYYAHFDKFSAIYKKAHVDYVAKYVTPLREDGAGNFLLEKWRLRDSVLVNTFHKAKGLVYDVTKIRALDYDLKQINNAENAKTYWEALSAQIKHPFLKEEGARFVAKMYPNIPQMSKTGIDGKARHTAKIEPTVHDLPEGKGKSIFEKIIAPHKGKIVFVDFWATWCGPCVFGIKNMEETRKKYANQNDFDFVFITGESSPEKKYNAFIADQDLKNTTRLSEDEFNYLRQLFEFNGIPRYILVDKNGNVVNTNFSMYRFNEQLDTILETYK